VQIKRTYVIKRVILSIAIANIWQRSNKENNKSVPHGAENHCETKRANHNYREEMKRTDLLSFNFFAVIRLLVSFSCKLQPKSI